MPDLEQVKGKISFSADTSGVDKAKGGIEGFGGALNRIGEIAAGVGLERLAEKFVDVGMASAKFAIQTAGDFEQWKIGFDTMLGSGKEASKLLSEISDFAVKTPFELPQLVGISKQLLAYGIESKNMIPTLQTLGDIAAGIGMDKLPQLTLAFGQVHAATKLTGMELRQFSEAGVPMLDALVNNANKAGGMLVTMGGSGKKAKVDIGELNDKLGIAKQRLDEASHAAHTKKSTLMSLQNTVQNYEQKLGTASGAQHTFSQRVKVTKEQMIGMISDGKVSFDMVQEALTGMTGKGGKFFNMMQNQSKTFNGVVSNIRDNFSRLALDFMGFDMVVGSATFGTIKDGSLFDQLRIGANGFLDWMNTNKPTITAFFMGIRTGIDFLIEVFMRLAAHIQTAFTPVLANLAEVYQKHKKVLDILANTIGVLLYAAIVTLIYAAAGWIYIFTELADYLLTTWGPTIQSIGDIITAVGANWDNIIKNMKIGFIMFVNDVVNAINILIDGINRIPGMKVGKLGEVSFASVSVAPSAGQIGYSAPGFIGPTKPQAIGPSKPNALQQSLSKSSAINIYNQNTFNQPTDITQFTKLQGWQVANAGR